MKSEPLKCVITEVDIRDIDTRKEEVKIGVVFSGKYANESLKALSNNNLAMCSALEITIDKVNTSKTWEQIKTVYLLFSIYDRFLHANIEGYTDYQYKKLKRNMKEKYGVFEDFERIDGTMGVEFLSLSAYKRKQAIPMISGMMDEMIKGFAEYRWEDKRFDNMVVDFNSQKIEPNEEIELF